MSKPWFRHYVGMTRDDKLMGVAGRTKQPLDRVLFVWVCLLESASEIEDGGRYEIDAETVAYNLRCDASDITKILLALEVAERVSGGVVTKWGSRQYDSDTSRDRMRRHRERQNGSGNGQKPHSDGTNGGGDKHVTSQKRSVTRPDTDTDTEKKKEDAVLSDGGAEPLAARHVEAEILGPEPVDPEKRLFDTGKAVLLRGPNPIEKGGGLIAKLLKAHNGNVAAAQERVDRAARAQDPAEFLAGCIKSAAGPPARPDPYLDAARKMMDRLNASTH